MTFGSALQVDVLLHRTLRGEAVEKCGASLPELSQVPGGLHTDVYCVGLYATFIKKI